ncbi:MAG: RNA 2',3'-cyclic phosphodiesterase [Candidatus Altiarchaeota archaeon]
MRMFLAIECPEDVKDKLVPVQKDAAKYCTMKKVEYGNLHLTLKFLGEVDSADSVVAALNGVKHKGFDITVSGLGVFPNASNVRVLWAGVGVGAREVVSLQKEVDAALKPLGFQPDGRFHPHLTLGRVKSVEDRGGFQSLLTPLSEVQLGSYHVGEFVLMESRLTSEGAIYSKVGNFPFL